MDSHLDSGVRLGLVEINEEKISGMPEGCLKVQSVKRNPEAGRWGNRMMESIRGGNQEDIDEEKIHLVMEGRNAKAAQKSSEGDDKPHSKECRVRVEAAIKNDAA